MKTPFNLFWVIWVLLSTISVTGVVKAEESPFAMAWSLQPVSLDPQYKVSLRANDLLQNHIFEPLFLVDSSGRIKPVLVQEFVVEDSLNWLITMKKNIYFHDGTELTTEDVLATFRRMDGLGKDNAFRQFLMEGIKFTKVGRYQFRITTVSPEPELLGRMALFKIISKKYEFASEADFNSGKAVVGTGPYRWGGQEGMKHFQFTAYERYHGRVPHIKHAMASVVVDRKKRIEGFLKGEFDLIDALLPGDMSALQASRNARFSMPNGDKLYHIRLDHKRDTSPFVRDNKGRPMEKNPLKNSKVRQAISLAIDRQLLIDKFFGGNGGSPAGQLVNKGYWGYMPRLLPDEQNYQKARLLLGEAGYPKGFRVTLHDKEARKPILDAIAIMLSNIGIEAKVEALPPAQYFPRSKNHDFSIGLLWSSSDGSLRALLEDLIRSNGSVNTGRYSNPDIDIIIAKAVATFDPDERYRLYSHAMELAMKDYAVIPLYFINDIWAIRSDMAYIPDTLGVTLAQYVKPNQVSLLVQ